MDYNITSSNARWSVLWMKKVKKEWVVFEHECGNDLSEALRLYTKAIQANKPMATLRCMNVGWAPPEKYQPHYETKKQKVRGKTKRTKIYVEPMVEYNAQGIVWCPYCMKLRRYETVDTFDIDGIEVDERSIQCPMCGVSHRDGHMRKWNPICNRLYVTPPNTRRGKPNRGKKRKR